MYTCCVINSVHFRLLLMLQPHTIHSITIIITNPSILYCALPKDVLREFSSFYCSASLIDSHIQHFIGYIQNETYMETFKISGGG